MVMLVTESLVKLLLKKQENNIDPFLWRLFINTAILCLKMCRIANESIGFYYDRNTLSRWTLNPHINSKYMSCFYGFVKVMGSTLDDLIYKRSEYQENCTRFLKATFPTGTGEWSW